MSGVLCDETGWLKVLVVRRRGRDDPSAVHGTAAVSSPAGRRRQSAADPDSALPLRHQRQQRPTRGT